MNKLYKISKTIIYFRCGVVCQRIGTAYQMAIEGFSSFDEVQETNEKSN
jgi:hypothetical protein